MVRPKKKAFCKTYQLQRSLERQFDNVWVRSRRAMAFFFNTETEIGNASGTDGSVQPHGKAILIKLKSKLYKLY